MLNLVVIIAVFGAGFAIAKSKARSGFWAVTPWPLAWIGGFVTANVALSQGMPMDSARMVALGGFVVGGCIGLGALFMLLEDQSDL